MITAHDITRGKPDPEPYLKGAALLGFAPQDCVVIEDAAAGVRSGKAAGARVIALQTTETNDDLIALGADWIVKDCQLPDSRNNASRNEGPVRPSHHQCHLVGHSDKCLLIIGGFIKQPKPSSQTKLEKSNTDQS